MALGVAAALCAQSASPLLAADAPSSPSSSSKDYTKSYGVVLLLIGLGVLMVCRPGRRSDQAKQPTESDVV